MIEFEENCIKVKEMLAETAVTFLHEAAGELKSAIKRNSRVDTGQTRGSYFYRVDKDNLEAIIGSNLENAIWEEFGTGEYAVNGNGRKGGWVYHKGDKFYVTRGKRPNKPITRAFVSEKERIKQAAESVFRSA